MNACYQFFVLETPCEFTKTLHAVIASRLEQKAWGEELQAWQVVGGASPAGSAALGDLPAPLQLVLPAPSHAFLLCTAVGQCSASGSG